MCLTVSDETVSACVGETALWGGGGGLLLLEQVAAAGRSGAAGVSLARTGHRQEGKSFSPRAPVSVSAPCWRSRPAVAKEKGGAELQPQSHKAQGTKMGLRQETELDDWNKEKAFRSPVSIFHPL